MMTAIGLAMSVLLASPGPAATEVTLEQLRHAVAGPQRPESIGGVSLVAFRFSRELELGQGIRSIAISRELGGALIAFGPDGHRIGTVDTAEVHSIQLFDLNEDGVSEVLLEEVDGRGTGVLEKSFHLYSVIEGRLLPVWQGKSYLRSAPWDSRRGVTNVDERRGFVRFDPSSSGRPARLTHLPPSREGQAPREVVLEMRGRVVAPPASGSRSN